MGNLKDVKRTADFIVTACNNYQAFKLNHAPYGLNENELNTIRVYNEHCAELGITESERETLGRIIREGGETLKGDEEQLNGTTFGDVIDHIVNSAKLHLAATGRSAVKISVRSAEFRFLKTVIAEKLNIKATYGVATVEDDCR